jgi:hypothetical protein
MPHCRPRRRRTAASCLLLQLLLPIPPDGRATAAIAATTTSLPSFIVAGGCGGMGPRTLSSSCRIGHRRRREMVPTTMTRRYRTSLATDALSPDAGRPLPSTTSRSNTNQSLRQKIIHGAGQKLLKNKYNPTSSSDEAPPAVGARKEPRVAHRDQCTYYIRAARRSGESTLI